MRLQRLIMGILIMGMLFTVKPQDKALACSGYPYFGVEDLPTMELLVKATVIDTDEHHNAILRIEAYYKGEGARFVTVMRHSPALTAGALVRGYDTGCLYAGRGHRWIKGSQGYFGLRSNGNGTFTDAYGGTAHFYPVDGYITYEEGATEGYYAEFDDALKITEEEFIAKMLEAGERDTPIAPTDEVVNFYPLMRFLTITTEKGTRYQINPDRSVMELPEDAPLDISPDGAHVAFKVDEKHIAFQYIWTDYDEDEEDSTVVPVTGKAVRFSNESNFAAVWDETQLTVYMFSNKAESSMYGYGTGMNVIKVAEVKLTAREDILPVVMWSADSSTLVWEDATGIWHWNIYEEAASQQLMKASEIEEGAALLDVSMYGRYVRTGAADAWTLIDAETQETYENVISSPNEQFLIYLNGSLPENSEKQECKPPLRDTCTVTYHTDVTDTFIYEGNLIGYLSCSDVECLVQGHSWHPAIESSYASGYLMEEIVRGLRQVAYDPQHQQAALVIGDYTLYFDFYHSSYFEEEEWLPYLDYLELEDVLDSPIASIEWGQPVFYEEYFLMTSEYLPE